MPSPVDKYFDEIKKQNPSYTDEQAWATAWSIFCRYKEPGSEHCHKAPNEYFKGRSAGLETATPGDVQRILRVIMRDVVAIPNPSRRTLAAQLQGLAAWVEKHE